MATVQIAASHTSFRIKSYYLPSYLKSYIVWSLVNKSSNVHAHEVSTLRVFASLSVDVFTSHGQYNKYSQKPEKTIVL